MGETMQQIQPFHIATGVLHKLAGVGLILVAVGSQQVSASQVSAEKVANPAIHLAHQAALQPSLAPLDLDMMQQGLCASEAKGVTDTSVSQTALTIPSFWWTRDQIAAQPQFGSKLVDSWLACPGQANTPSRADFVVNQQVWSLLDYLERYEFVHELGTAASSYGYDLRVFNRQGVVLAAYTCDFKAATVAIGLKTPAADEPPQNSKLKTQNSLTATPSLTCAVSLNSSGKAGFRGRSNGLDGAFPTRGGTERP